MKLHFGTNEKSKKETLYCLCVRWSKKVTGVKSHEWEKWSIGSSMQSTLDAFDKLGGTKSAKRDYDFAVFEVVRSKFKLTKLLRTA